MRDLLKRKRNSVSYGVLYWNYFKRNFLENEFNRSALARLPKLSHQQFRSWIRKLARPSKYGPYPCTGKRYSARVKENNVRYLIHACFAYYSCLLSPTSPFCVKRSTLLGGGSGGDSGDINNGDLGLFTKKRLTVRRDKFLNPRTLFGCFFPTTPNDQDSLDLIKHPSVLEVGSSPGILCGPVSLLHHSCSSFLYLMENPPLLPLTFEECEGFDLIGIENTGSKAIVIEQNEEILINYGRDYFRKNQCRCSKCSKKKIDERTT